MNHTQLQKTEKLKKEKPENLEKQSPLQTKVANLPHTPGVYKFKNSANKILYVGKAKNLKSRVGSYFVKNLDPASKTAVLVTQITDVEYVETFSELEALILEAELIKKHKPKYNIALKDDKSYLYIVIRPEKVELNGKKVNLPKVLAVREPDLQETDATFGPYPDSGTTKHVVRTIRKVFPYRDCSNAKFTKYKKQGQPCLYGHIGLCQAPCTGKITPEHYKNDIKRIKNMLAGESVRLLSSLEREMKTAAKQQQYERAAQLRDTLRKFEYVRTRSTTAQKYIDNPYLVQDLREKALNDLVKAIPSLNTMPLRIETYDISNISGKDAVGSMVVAINGEVQKSEYKRFKIKTKAEPDDFAMLTEVLVRRLKNDWELPDLLVVDGGKGQVSAAIDALNQLNMQLPVIGLAKKFETIVYVADTPTGQYEFKELVLTRDNNGLMLLQRLRDEAHRFAQSYHHKLRLKQLTE